MFPGGLEELCREARVPFPADRARLAEAIKKYYELWRNSPQEYYNMNKAIREHIMRNYDWDIIIDKLEVMFKSTLIT